MNMSTSSKPATSKKRQSKPKDPPGPNRAVINWKEEEFHKLCQRFKFPSEWGAQYPTTGSTALNTPPGYMKLYAAFFREGNFCLLMSNFLKLVPTVEMFNVFYYVTYAGGFYSFSSRTANVLPCSRDPLKSFHDWKNKFFYIRRGVIPIDMHYRAEREWVPKVVLVGSYADRE
ncbi:hypothetical protein HanLR1_Chr07g0238791 [Helianthus annuus]|nr:hypothetical protein HanLR1_Chr07g0238791 [Helianthus annuus]